MNTSPLPYPLAALLILLLLSAGCENQRPPPHPSLAQDQVKTYQHIVHEYGHQNPRDHFSAYAVKEHRIRQNEANQAGLSIQPIYFSSGASFLGLSSRTTYGWSLRVDHDVLTEPHFSLFESVPDSTDSHPQATAFGDATGDRTERIRRAFHFDQIHQLAFHHDLPYKKGQQLKIGADGWFNELVITVIQVTTNNLYLSVQADTSDGRLFGYQVINRNTGWPQSSLFIAQREVDTQDSPITLMSGLYTEHSDLSSMLHRFSSLLPPHEPFVKPAELDTLLNLTEDSVFPGSDLHLHYKEDHLATLVYPHDFQTRFSPGRVELTLQTDTPGFKLAAETGRSYEVSYRAEELGQINSEFRVHLLEWDPEAIPNPHAPQFYIGDRPMTEKEISQMIAFSHPVSHTPDLCAASTTTFYYVILKISNTNTLPPQGVKP